jgi:hypothetical protein
LKDDYADVNFNIVDNGDDNIAIEFLILKDKMYVTVSTISNIAQVRRESQIMIAGAGD